jgi:isopenicillin N synthase-like dioxygenase
MERFLIQVEAFSLKFIRLLAEAFGLPPNALDKFHDSKHLMQHRQRLFSIPY